MKQLTLQELARIVSISEGTIRSWTLKPIQGQPYSSKNVNYEELRAHLVKYFGSDETFVKRFGFSIDEIELIKGERTSREYVELTELAIGDKIVLHNYALRTEMTLVSQHIVNAVSGQQIELWTFELAEKANSFKSYTEVQLTSANIKLEKLKSEAEN